MTDNIIAVSDYGGDQVKYSPQGEFLSVIGCCGNKNGQFNCPKGLTFNNNKLLYVIDGYNYIELRYFNMMIHLPFHLATEGVILDNFSGLLE